MTRNGALDLAIRLLRKYAREYYGHDAKHKPEHRAEYDKIFQCITILEGLKEKA